MSNPTNFRAAFKSARDYWLFFATEARNGRCPLYHQLATAIADDEEMQEVAARARPGQPRANLLFGAVHFILLGGADHPLKAYYPHLMPEGAPAPSADAYPVFKDFVAQHRFMIEQIIPARVTNTNEVRRSATLYPAFTHLSRVTQQKLNLIEIGPSAGLNLRFDRYAYAYRAPDSAVTHCGDFSSPLTLECDAIGPLRPSLSPHPPAIESRVGLELNPVDLTDEADRRWLKALIWPGPVERMRRLEQAIEIVRQDPPLIRAGDGVRLLPEAIAALPKEGMPIVYHSHVTYQFPTALKDALDSALLEASKSRPLIRVSIEWDGADYPIIAQRYARGEVQSEVLALCHHHGEWIEWKLVG